MELPTVLNDANEAAAWRDTIEAAVWSSVATRYTDPDGKVVRAPRGRWPESRYRFNPFESDPPEHLVVNGRPSGSLPPVEPPAAGWADLDVQETYLLAGNAQEASRRLVQAERIATSETASTSQRRKAAAEARYMRGYIESANKGIRESSRAWLPQLAPFMTPPEPPAPVQPKQFVGAW